MADMFVKKPSQQEIELASHWSEWEKEPSEFPWFYDQKETCYILQGRAEVIDQDGNRIHFQKGDWVVFDQGVECTWIIHEHIRKKYQFE